ncbi:hypothetical protein DFP72DRAFT_849497 [Ephemerocybe angulata]|uniref:Uncharacterized protein n=1 Tax=Ephemerocybe angulata TaxID=980116 RepID=A0A8H6HTX4_9AGAR|nr:hypothetical protein DFP72DRAFT_849497 [Tulosesus angulatus]
MQPEFYDRPSRSLARPTRPLPSSLGSSQILHSSFRHATRPGFSPSPSPTPSASLSLTTGYSHLVPKSPQHLSPYQQWQQAQQASPQTFTQSHSTSPAPVSRKRGWEPSNSSPSGSQTTLASGSGYLDTPAKYREMAEMLEVVQVDRRELDTNASFGSFLDIFRISEGGKLAKRPSVPSSHQTRLCAIVTRVTETPFRQRRGDGRLSPFKLALLSLCPFGSVLCAIGSLTILYLLATLLLTVHVWTRILLSAHVDLPPTKRRRGIAGSIVETAWSAALIGTAVGLTVYKLWRDRGKAGEEDEIMQEDGHRRKRRAANFEFETDAMSIESPPLSEPSSPPPPYNQEWTAINYPRTVPTSPSRRAELQGKAKMTPRSARKAPTVRPHAQRRDRLPPHLSGIPPPIRTPVAPAFDFNFGAGSNSGGDHPSRVDRGRGVQQKEEEPEVEDQMDWIGGKLAQLIEEGKKALKTEVVVMSDAQEDEVDDGSGAWVSDDEDGHRGRNRNGSVRRRGSTASATRYHSSKRSAGTPQPQIGSMHSPVGTPPRSTATRGGIPQFGSGTGVEDSCESPEVREMMERARAKIAARAYGR